MPAVTVLGLAERLIVGESALTVTVTDCSAVPPVPVQDRVYSVVTANAPVDCEPTVASLPVQPFKAVQESA